MSENSPSSSLRSPRAEALRARVRCLAPAWLLVAPLLTLGVAPTLAQENGDCFTCHADKDLSKKRAGKTVSLFVDETRFATGAHGKLPCIGCHARSSSYCLQALSSDSMVFIHSP